MFNFFLFIFCALICSGSYYSGRGDEDGYACNKSEMGCMDDSETSLCELDDNNGINRSSNSESDQK